MDPGKSRLLQNKRISGDIPDLVPKNRIKPPGKSAFLIVPGTLGTAVNYQERPINTALTQF